MITRETTLKILTEGDVIKSSRFECRVRLHKTMRIILNY